MKVAKKVLDLVTDAVIREVSDIHFHPHEETVDIYFRINDEIDYHEQIEIEYYEKILRYIKFKTRLDISQKKIPQDGAFDVELEGFKVFMRISTVPLVNNESLVIRIIGEDKQNKMEDISFHKSDLTNIYNAIKSDSGLFVFTGPTGSGKSTSMYSILNEMATKDNKKIICIENPVEVINANFIQIQITDDGKMDYSKAIRSSLRQDPDVIMIGEIRDEDTARIVFRAALTGHTVISTMHTRNKYGVIERFIDFGFLQSEITSVLIGVSNQRLILDKNNEIKALYDYAIKDDLKEMIEHGEKSDITTQIEKLKEAGEI